jgi:formylglycine-generating enzyme required for sulfatase activity
VPKTPGMRCLLRATARAPQNLTATMALIPAGTFRMGDLTGAGLFSQEHPPHDVTISRPFLMGRTEVTKAQWAYVMGTYPADPAGEKFPVDSVPWRDALRFCNTLSRLGGLDTCYSGAGASISCDFSKNGYRLPTEAEWEYACRAGTWTDYYTGNENMLEKPPALDAAGWYAYNSGSHTHAVGTKAPNAFGLYDMHGNVHEWCWDWFSSTTYTSSPVTDPHGPATGTERVLRGGSHGMVATGCRSAFRYRWDPDFRHAIVVNSIGFRVVRNF